MFVATGCTPNTSTVLVQTKLSCVDKDAAALQPIHSSRVWNVQREGMHHSRQLFFGDGVVHCVTSEGFVLTVTCWCDRLPKSILRKHSCKGKLALNCQKKLHNKVDASNILCEATSIWFLHSIDDISINLIMPSHSHQRG